MIHLDTSFLIRALVAGSAEDRALRRWLGTNEAIRVSAPVWTEFLCGPVSRDAVDAAAEFLGEPVAFGGDAATLAAELFNAAGRRRGSVVDCMVAATAIQANARLATRNQSDFSRLQRLGLGLAPP